VCVCVRERERERESEWVSVCVCVCEWVWGKVANSKFHSFQHARTTHWNRYRNIILKSKQKPCVVSDFMTSRILHTFLWTSTYFDRNLRVVWAKRNDSARERDACLAMFRDFAMLPTLQDATCHNTENLIVTDAAPSKTPFRQPLNCSTA
jgi:hypothetical protein